MKKLLFLVVGLFILSLNVSAIEDKPIQVTEMPKAAQLFIKNYFVNQPVAMATVEQEFMGKSYDVVFTNGDKVEFDKKGKWTNVDCRHSEVPQTVVPATIRQYISKNYPEVKVLQIELTDRKGYDVNLSNGVEVEFDRRFNVVEIDR